jgi:hypothetical protein
LSLINVEAVVDDTRRTIDAAFADPLLHFWLADRKPTYLRTLEAMAEAQRDIGNTPLARLCDDTWNRLNYWEGPDAGDVTAHLDRARPSPNAAA